MSKIIVQKSKRAGIRKRRVRKFARGQEGRPRLTVFVSNKHVFAQIIDDLTAKTLVSASDNAIKGKATKQETAKLVGQAVAREASGKGIKKVVFDRGSKLYHGRVKALADGAREAGLEF